MARSGSTQKKTEQDYREFEYTGKEFKYTGRIWPGTKTEGKNADRTSCNLTLNGVITIRGIKLVQTDSSCFFAFPQYQTKAGDYSSYIYTDKEFSQQELDAVAKEAEKALAK